MRTFVAIVLTIIFTVFFVSCAKQAQPDASQSLAEYRTTATVKDIMDSMVDPGADFIWQAVETVISAQGIEEKAPRTDEEWEGVRRHAIMVMEATNLLQIPGRHVARSGEKADDPS